jgi:dethiobiotin synthase
VLAQREESRVTTSAGVFVTGTDTGVGKTVVSACLVRAWHADHWKPVQTGVATETADTPTVAELSGAAADRLHLPRHVFAQPLSVEAAAAAEGAQVILTDFVLPASARPLVVEGAGGVLVPIAPGVLMVDLICRFGLPVVVVARTTLGTINHTLLTLDALRARALNILGVVLVGPANPGNERAIARHGAVPILAHVPPLSPLSAATVATASALFPSWQDVTA